MNTQDYHYLYAKKEEFLSKHGNRSELKAFIAPSDPGVFHYEAFEVALRNKISTTNEIHFDLPEETFHTLYVSSGLIESYPFPMDIYVIPQDLIVSKTLPAKLGAFADLRSYCIQNNIPFEY